MITVRANQTAFDLSLQETGNVEAAFEVAARIGVSITTEMQPGVELLGRLVSPTTEAVLEYYTRNNIHPATRD